jgi:hypothetical protein
MALLCGRAGRLTSQNGGFRPGQVPHFFGAEEVAAMANHVAQFRREGLLHDQATTENQVRHYGPEQ